jgi:hypothetical protein
MEEHQARQERRLNSHERKIGENAQKIRYLSEEAEITDPAADQWGAQPVVTDTERLKNHIRIMDDTFSRDIRFLREKLEEAKQLIEAQALRIKTLEDKQPLIESATTTQDPAKPSFQREKSDK